jgi:hypothetical protein
MEVAMTRTAIRHTLSALAAAALVSAFAAAPASAVGQTSQLMSNIYKADSDAKLGKPTTQDWLKDSDMFPAETSPKVPAERQRHKR